MNLLHPWFFVVGLSAVLLPLAIHWLTKPRPRRMPLSTIRFVKQAVKQKRARYRLRDLLVMLLRGAAVVLLGWAFARPLTGAKPLIAPGEAGDAIRVVLLDSSLSMAAVSGGQSAFDRARADAVRYVQYEPGLRCDLILAGAKAKPVIGSASANFAGLRDALAASQPLPQRLDVQGAINRAAEILSRASRSPAARMEMIIVSDFQRSSWARADFSPLPKETLIQFDSVAPAQTPSNIAIIRAGGVGRIEQGRETRIEVDVGNYSNTPRDIQVEVTAGELSCRLSGVCPPAVKTTLTGTIIPRAAGWISGKARLLDVQDALSADNERPFTLDVRPPPTYALITRESSKPHASSSHFLERALAPIKPKDGEPGERVIRFDPTQPDREVLASASLLVLDHPGKLSQETINLLAAMVRRGRGMLYVVAEPIDATNLKLLADAAGNDLKMPVEFQPSPGNQPRSDLFLLEWRKNQPPFKAMGEAMAGVAGELRFSGGLSSRRLESGLQDDVLAAYSDRSACLVVTAFGAGSLAVLNCDLTESDLPASSIFVPMLGELSGRLLATGTSPDALPCGEPYGVYLPSVATTVEGLSVFGPDGAKQTDAVISQEGSFVLWRGEAAGPSGIYQLRRGNETICEIATAAPGSESDLETLDPPTLKTRLASGRPVYFQGADDQPQKDDRWAWILVGCTVCMIGEFGVLKMFRT